MENAIDEFEEKDDSQWSNIKALQGPEWKGRLRKTVGPYRIIFRKFPDRAVVEISAILLKSKDTYRQDRIGQFWPIGVSADPRKTWGKHD